MRLAVFKPTGAQLAGRLLVGLLLVAPAALADPPVDWSVAAKPDVVEVLTTNEDGSTRETKVWIVAVDGQGYLRTGGTRWYVMQRS